MNTLEKKGPLFRQRSLFFALPFKQSSNNVFLNITYTDKVINHIQYTTEFQQTIDPLPFAQVIEQQLKHYFQQPGFKFSLSCQMNGATVFQQKVWQALMQIPPGKVKTYGALAAELGSSARAVGNACRNNPFPLLIPCHRVVSASGIGGYAGDTLQQQKGEIEFMKIKQWLLAHEQNPIE